MRYKIEIDTQTKKIDLFKITSIYNHVDTQHKEHVGWVIGRDRSNILRLIEELACEESLYEIFVGIYNAEIELMRVAENKSMRIATHVRWLRGKERQIILKAIEAIAEESKDSVDLDADFVDNELNRALNK